MTQDEFMRSLRRYTYGFGLCLLLSVASYLIVVSSTGMSGYYVAGALLLLAIVQIVVQLVCFLHVGPDRSVYSKASTILLTVGMAFVLIVGSIWIMRNLDYRMGMSPEAMQEFMEAQNKKGF